MRVPIIATALLLVTSVAGAQNVAAGKTVTQFGATGSVGPTGWEDPAPAPASTITDGVIAGAGQHWQGPGPADVRTVWWTDQSTYFEIALGGYYDITGFNLNADNNDAYTVAYWNGASWVDAFTTTNAMLWGMHNFTTTLGSAITTDRLRLSAAGPDYLYSVSELQAIGTTSAVPEPATVVLLGTGLAGIALVARRRRSGR